MKQQRRRLVAPEPALPLELVDPTSQLRVSIEETDALVCAGQAPSALLQLIRKNVGQYCAFYKPMKDEGYPDGLGLLCASGREGNAVMRGKLCTKVCAVGNCDASARQPDDPKVIKNALRSLVTIQPTPDQVSL